MKKATCSLRYLQGQGWGEYGYLLGCSTPYTHSCLTWTVRTHVLRPTPLLLSGGVLRCVCITVGQCKSLCWGHNFHLVAKRLWPLTCWALQACVSDRLHLCLKQKLAGVPDRRNEDRCCSRFRCRVPVTQGKRGNWQGTPYIYCCQSNTTGTHVA
jgi:hypothetical protein